MEPELLDEMIRAARSRPIFPPSARGERLLGRSEIERLIPHRPPFLLLDTVSAVDLKARRIEGTRTIDPNDPLFVGHFPGDPLYPGALQLEVMGQLGLCLFALEKNGRVEVLPEDVPRAVRALKVHHAAFLSAVRPNDQLVVLSNIVDADDYTGICMGQILKGGQICSFGVMEVYFVD